MSPMEDNAIVFYTEICKLQVAILRQKVLKYSDCIYNGKWKLLHI